MGGEWMGKGGDVLNVVLSDSYLNVRVKGGEFVPLIKIILSYI